MNAPLNRRGLLLSALTGGAANAADPPSPRPSISSLGITAQRAADLTRIGRLSWCRHRLVLNRRDTKGS